ncbi:UNVERIFIED_CONTAM: hypothetical protein Sangu_1651700 [Sesamum angustifolium]|uniref:Uncharacterized protein n=1 Tax=Sesamum angustifolium TaxID=2727405 RepID=A0AAW2MKI5_9LAMI
MSSHARQRGGIMAPGVARRGTLARGSVLGRPAGVWGFLGACPPAEPWIRTQTEKKNYLPGRPAWDLRAFATGLRRRCRPSRRAATDGFPRLASRALWWYPSETISATPGVPGPHCPSGDQAA